MTEEEMRALRSQGASYREIGERVGVTAVAIFYRLGGVRKRRKPRAANDNNRDVVRRPMPFNGGCSSTSGMQAISLPRVTFIDGAAA